MFKVAIAIFASITLFASSASAQDISSEIVGVWKMTSFTRQEGDKLEYPYGKSPSGYLIYTRGGHYVSFFTADDRKAPAGPQFTDPERALLLRTMVAHSGTYNVTGNRVTQRITASWNQTWTGTERTVTYDIQGKTMTSRAQLGAAKIVNSFEKVE
jgi:hypothetical protein